MKEWKVILATLVIFGAGVVTGGLLVSHSLRPRAKANPNPQQIAKQQQQLRPPWHDQRYEYIRYIEKQLNLSPEQREKIDQFVSDSQQRTKSLWDGVAPKMSEEVKGVKEQIRGQLTPEQRKKFDELNKQRLPRKDWRSEVPPMRNPGEFGSQFLPPPGGQRGPVQGSGNRPPAPRNPSPLTPDPER